MSSRKRRSAEVSLFSGRVDQYAFAIPLTIGAIADTHILDGSGSRPFPVEALALFRRFHVDLIVHAGDIAVQSVLDRLGTVAPVLAVRGNNESLELWERLPERMILTVGPHTIGLVHGYGGTTARATARQAFGKPVELVIYGHSHIPMIEEADGVVYFNPGSATDRRWSPHFGIGVVTIDDRGIRPELILFDAAAHLASIEPASVPGEFE